MIDYFFFAEKVYEVCLPIIKAHGDWKIDERSASKELEKTVNIILGDTYYFDWSSFLGTYYSMVNTLREYKQKMDVISFAPFWMYEAECVSCKHLHQNYNKLLLRYDDSFWQKYFPPNSWECGCRVRNFTADQLKGREVKTIKEVVNYFKVYPPFDINFAKNDFKGVYKKLFIQHFVTMFYEYINYGENEDEE